MHICVYCHLNEWLATLVNEKLPFYEIFAFNIKNVDSDIVCHCKKPTFIQSPWTILRKCHLSGFEYCHTDHECFVLFIWLENSSNEIELYGLRYWKMSWQQNSHQSLTKLWIYVYIWRSICYWYYSLFTQFSFRVSTVGWDQGEATR